MNIIWPTVSFALAQILWWAGVVKNSWETLLWGIAMHFVSAGLFLGWALS